MDSGFAADATPRNDDLRGKISRERRLAQNQVGCLLRSMLLKSFELFVYSYYNPRFDFRYS